MASLESCFAVDHEVGEHQELAKKDKPMVHCPVHQMPCGEDKCCDIHTKDKQANPWINVPAVKHPPTKEESLAADGEEEKKEPPIEAPHTAKDYGHVDENEEMGKRHTRRRRRHHHHHDQVTSTGLRRSAFSPRYL